MSERKLMKAFQILEFGKPLVWRDVEKPIPGSYEVLVRSRVTGICHTDLHIADGDLGNVDLPLTPGHEGVGVVECVGSKVTNFAPGDRIGVPWLGETCQSCTFCTKGYSNVCPKQRQTGFLRQGTCAEYFLADSRCSVLIPQNIADNEAAPVLCAGLTAYKAIKISGAVAGNLVVIAGSCGGLGHLAVQYAKAMGLSVIALDLMDDRKRLTMKALGADYVVDVKNMNEELEKIKENITKAIIFVPLVGAVTSAIIYIAPGGTVVCVGLSKENFTSF